MNVDFKTMSESKVQAPKGKQELAQKLSRKEWSEIEKLYDDFIVLVIESLAEYANADPKEVKKEKKEGKKEEKKESSVLANTKTLVLGDAFYHQLRKLLAKWNGGVLLKYAKASNYEEKEKEKPKKNAKKKGKTAQEIREDASKTRIETQFNDMMKTFQPNKMVYRYGLANTKYVELKAICFMYCCYFLDTNPVKSEEIVHELLVAVTRFIETMDNTKGRSVLDETKLETVASILIADLTSWRDRLIKRFPFDGLTIYRNSPRLLFWTQYDCGIPTMGVRPRESQVSLIQSVRDNMKDGFMIIYKAVPGSGKTTMPGCCLPLVLTKINSTLPPKTPKWMQIVACSLPNVRNQVGRLSYNSNSKFAVATMDPKLQEPKITNHFSTKDDTLVSVITDPLVANELRNSVKNKKRHWQELHFIDEPTVDADLYVTPAQIQKEKDEVELEYKRIASIQLKIDAEKARIKLETKKANADKEKLDIDIKNLQIEQMKNDEDMQKLNTRRTKIENDIKNSRRLTEIITLIENAPPCLIISGATMCDSDEIPTIQAHHKKKYPNAKFITISQDESKIGCDVMTYEGDHVRPDLGCETVEELKMVIHNIARDPFLGRLYTPHTALTLWESMAKMKIPDLVDIKEEFKDISNLSLDRTRQLCKEMLEQLSKTDDKTVKEICKTKIQEAKKEKSIFPFNDLGCSQSHKFLNMNLIVALDPIKFAEMTFKTLLEQFEGSAMVASEIYNDYEQRLDAYEKRVKEVEKKVEKSMESRGKSKRSGESISEPVTDKATEIATKKQEIMDDAPTIHFPVEYQINTPEHLKKFASKAKVNEKETRKTYPLEMIPYFERIPDWMQLLLWAGVGIYSKNLPDKYNLIVLEMASSGSLFCVISDREICYGTNYPFYRVFVTEEFAETCSLNTLFQLFWRAGRVGVSWKAEVWIGALTALRLMKHARRTGKEVSIEAVNMELCFKALFQA